MKIPNINCIYYTSYGKCLKQKGWFFYKICPLSQDFSIKCEIGKAWVRPRLPTHILKY